MSSKYCCDNSTKDKALECLKCEDNTQSVVYNKDENIIYMNCEKDCCEDMGIPQNKKMFEIEMRLVMREARKYNNQSPQIVHL
jgi:hypothetical protein